MQRFVEIHLFQKRKELQQQIGCIPGHIGLYPTGIGRVCIIIQQRESCIKRAFRHRQACGRKMFEIGELHTALIPECSGINSPVQCIKHSELYALPGRKLRQVIGRRRQRTFQREGTVITQCKGRVSGFFIYFLSSVHPIIMSRCIFQGKGSFQQFIFRHRIECPAVRNIRLRFFLEPAPVYMILQHLSSLPGKRGRKQQTIRQFDLILERQETLLIEFHIIPPEERRGNGIYQTGFSTFSIIIGRKNSAGQFHVSPSPRSITQGEFTLPCYRFTGSGIISRRSELQSRCLR